MRISDWSSDVCSSDLGIDRIVSGPDWRVRPNPPEGWTVPTFDASAWTPPVISGSKVNNDPRPSEPAMLLRTDFNTTKKVVGARLYATALGAYDARINGERVSTAFLAPETSVAHKHVFYQVYDVTKLIRKGENALGVIVGDGWYAGAFGWRMERYGFCPAPRLLRPQLRLAFSDAPPLCFVPCPSLRPSPPP